MPRILVVDDEKSIRITLREFIRDRGYDVRVAEDADEALAVLETEDFDVVVTDIILPRLTGVDLLKSIRKLSFRAQVIMMTGEPTVETASEAVRAGAFDYLSKPISKNAILKVIDNALKIKKLEDENREHQETLESLVEERTRELRESEETARVLLDTNPNAAVLMDADGVISMLNAPMARRFGKNPGTLIGTSFYDHLPPEVARIRKIMAEKVIRSREPVCFEDERDEKILENRIYPVFNAAGHVDRISFFSSDITERRGLEQDRIRLGTAIEQSPESIVITDRDANIQYVNPAFEEITGYKLHEVIGRNPRILQSGQQENGFYRELWEVLGRGEVWKGHFINRKKDGSLFEEEASISPVKGAGGKITHYVAVKRDVTDEIRLKRQYQQAQKMEAIGTLAGGIAHDFNNILSPIIGYAELCADDLDPDTENGGYVREILKAAQRARDLVRQILSFSRQTREERKPIRMQLIIKEILKLIRASLPSTIEIRHRLETDSGILADPVEIHQMVMNLCTNAFQAMKDRGGVIEITLANVTLPDPMHTFETNLSPGPYIWLKVRDTGCGMNRFVLEHLFEPYFTTKAQNEGTGLGLAMVHGIVTSLQGEITVSSELGIGSVFTVFLPRMNRSEQKPESLIVSELPGGSENILLVDDETPICTMIRMMLERLGYHVRSENDPVSALKAFQNNSEAFDLLITDMTMPKMTGLELSGQIHRLRPDFPVILMTGYSHLVTEEKIRAFGIRGLVMKPVLKKDLAEAVRQALEN